MSFGLNQTVEAKQLVVDEFITAGDYAGGSYNRDLVIRAGDIEHSQCINFSVFSNGELNEVAKITDKGLETETILLNEIYTQDDVSTLGKIKICHDSDSGESGYCGELIVNLNCGLGSEDAFVDALRVTNDCVQAHGSIQSLSLETGTVKSNILNVSATPDCNVVAEFSHAQCKNSITIHEFDDQLMLSGNIIASTLSASDVHLDNVYFEDCISTKLHTEKLKIGSWDILPSATGLNIYGQGEVSLDSLNCVESTSEITNTMKLKTSTIEIDSSCLIALSVGNAFIMRNIGGDTYWKGGVVTEDIQSDDLINIDAPGMIIGNLQLKSEGSIIFNNTQIIDISDDCTTFNTNIHTNNNNVTTNELRSNSLLSDTISAMNVRTNTLDVEYGIIESLSASNIFSTTIYSKNIKCNGTIQLSNDTCSLNLQDGNISVKGDLISENDVECSKVFSSEMKSLRVFSDYVKAEEISCKLIGLSSCDISFFSDCVRLSRDTCVAGDISVSNALIVDSTVIQEHNTLYSKYLAVGNNIKIISDGGLCINSYTPDQVTALLDITSNEINKPLIKLSYEDHYMEFNIVDNGIIFDSDVPTLIPQLSVGTLVGIVTDPNSYNSLATVGFTESMFQPLTTSDDRIKSHTVPISNAIETIMKLNPVKYQKHPGFMVPIGVEDTDLTSITNFTEMGLVAQDIERVEELSFAVSVSADFNGNQIKTVDYNSVFSLSVKALQEQNLQLSVQSEALRSINDKFSANTITTNTIDVNTLSVQYINSSNLGLDDILCFNSIKNLENDKNIIAKSGGHACQIVFDKDASSLEFAFSALKLSVGDIFAAQVPSAAKIHYSGMTIGSDDISPGLVVANEGIPTIRIGNSDNNTTFSTREDHSLFYNTNRKFAFDGDIIADNISCNSLLMTDIKCETLSVSNIVAADVNINNLSVSNIFVSGSRTIVNVENTTTNSFIMTLGEENPSDSEIMGIFMNYTSNVGPQTAGIIRDPSLNAFALFDDINISAESNINNESYNLANLYCKSMISDDVVSNSLSVSGPVMAVEISVGNVYGSVFRIGNWDIEEDARGDLIFKNNGMISFRMRQPQ